jgi:EF hand
MRKSGGLVLAALAAAVTVVSVLPAMAQERNRGPQRMIEALDADKDGRLSLAEIEAEQQRLFATVDADKNGILSVEEFRLRGGQLSRFGGTTLFDLLDVNGDQMITADELAGPTGRWHRRYDTNGDGALETVEMTRDQAAQQQQQPRAQQQPRGGQQQQQPRGGQPQPPAP